MIKFIKKQWVMIIGVIIIVFGCIRIYDIITEEHSDYENISNSSYEITKNNIEILLNKANNTLTYEGNTAYSNQALANIEYLKLEQLEKLLMN